MLAERYNITIANEREIAEFEPADVFWLKTHLSWLRFDQVYEAALQYFSRLSEEYRNAILKHMNEKYDQWRSGEVDDLKVLEQWRNLIFHYRIKDNNNKSQEPSSTNPSAQV